MTDEKPSVNLSLEHQMIRIHARAVLPGENGPRLASDGDGSVVMVIDHVFGINRLREATTPNVILSIFAAVSRQLSQAWCGLHGHLVMMRFEPHKLSLQCSICGYSTEGWEVGRPMTARRQANNPQARPDRRRTLRPLSTNARLAS